MALARLDQGLVIDMLQAKKSPLPKSGDLLINFAVNAAEEFTVIGRLRSWPSGEESLCIRSNADFVPLP